MITLQEINENNWLNAARLEHGPEQGRFVGDALEILARAYVYRKENARALAIYKGEALVGLLLVRDLWEEPACYDLQELLIDQHWQNKGCAQAALSILLEELRDKNVFDISDVEYSPGWICAYIKRMLRQFTCTKSWALQTQVGWTRMRRIAFA